MANYVKFLRGTSAAYNNLTEYDSDTLYFICDEDKDDGELYLGSKLIAGAAADDLKSYFLKNLEDVSISENLLDKSILIYDAHSLKWEDKNVNDLIFLGAQPSSSGVAGFVPAPPKGELNLYLKSDGSWSALENLPPEVEEQLIIKVSNSELKDHSEIFEELAQTQDFSKGDIIIIEEGSERISYIFTNETWEALTEKYSSEKVFFLKDLNEDLNSKGKTLNEVLNEILSKFKADLSEIENSFNDLDSELTELSETVNKKADRSEVQELLNGVYTKEETLTKEEIFSAITGADHLKRRIVEDKDSIDINDKDALQYIYMVPSGLEADDNKYYEYVVIESTIYDEEIKSEIIVRQLEKVGTWEVDLSQYVKKEDNARLFTLDEAEKLTNIEDGAQVNIIDSISTDFEIVNDPTQNLIKQLRLNSRDREKLDSLVIGDEGDIEISGNVSIDKVQGLEEWLNNHASTTKGLSENNLTNELLEKLNNSIYITSVNEDQMSVNEGKLSINKIEMSIVDGLNDLLSNQTEKINDISTLLNNLKPKVEQNTLDIKDIKDILTWHTI